MVLQWPPGRIAHGHPVPPPLTYDQKVEKHRSWSGYLHHLEDKARAVEKEEIERKCKKEKAEPATYEDPHGVLRCPRCLSSISKTGRLPLTPVTLKSHLISRHKLTHDAAAYLRDKAVREQSEYLEYNSEQAKADRARV